MLDASQEIPGGVCEVPRVGSGRGQGRVVCIFAYTFGNQVAEPAAVAAAAGSACNRRLG